MGLGGAPWLFRLCDPSRSAVGGSQLSAHQNSSSDIGTLFLRTVGETAGARPQLSGKDGAVVSSHILGWTGPFGFPSGRLFRSDIPYFRARAWPERRAGVLLAVRARFSAVVRIKNLVNSNSSLSFKLKLTVALLRFHSITSHLQTTWVFRRSFQPK